MLVPVRCFTCSTPIAHLYAELLHNNSKGCPFEASMNQFNIHRYCCKRMLVTHVDIGRLVAEYKFTDVSDGLSKFQCVGRQSREVLCD